MLPWASLYYRSGQLSANLMQCPSLAACHREESSSEAWGTLVSSIGLAVDRFRWIHFILLLLFHRSADKRWKEHRIFFSEAKKMFSWFSDKTFFPCRKIFLSLALFFFCCRKICLVARKKSCAKKEKSRRKEKKMFDIYIKKTFFGIRNQFCGDHE